MDFFAYPIDDGDGGAGKPLAALLDHHGLSSMADYADEFASSSSSSSGDHSSPSAGSSASDTQPADPSSVPSVQAWPYSDEQTGWPTMFPGSMGQDGSIKSDSPSYALFGLAGTTANGSAMMMNGGHGEDGRSRHSADFSSAGARNETPDSLVSLASDFWAMDTDATSSSSSGNNQAPMMLPAMSANGEDTRMNHSASAFAPQELGFGDIVNEDHCGPSAGSQEPHIRIPHSTLEPLQSSSFTSIALTSSSMSSRLASSSGTATAPSPFRRTGSMGELNGMASLQMSNGAGGSAHANGAGGMGLIHQGFSTPVDLHAVNASIAPQSLGMSRNNSQESQKRRKGSRLAQQHNGNGNGHAAPIAQGRRAAQGQKKKSIFPSLVAGGDEDDEDEDDDDDVSSASEDEEDAGVSNNNTPPSRRDSPPRSSASSSAAAAAKAKAASLVPAVATTTIAAVPTVNLVARDAVIASQIIASLARPSPLSLLPALGAGRPAPLRLLVLGVPEIGAKSRVETQIKVSLVLVRELPSAPPVSQRRRVIRVVTGEDGPGVQGEEDQVILDEDSWLRTLDGELDAEAGRKVERIGSWKNVRLPSVLALKKAGKKGSNAAGVSDLPPEQMLNLQVKVIRASEPYDEIFICDGCRKREIKRSQRKRVSRGGAGANGAKPAAAAAAAKEEEDAKAGPGTTEEEELRKVVVFNCAEVVEFEEGEAMLPTRITCYCRHHKEKKGFVVLFELVNHLGHVVATGKTPPIMITDDHKTSTVRAKPSGSGGSATTIKAEEIAEDLSASVVAAPAKPLARSKNSNSAKSCSSLADLAAAEQAANRVRRTASAKGRGMRGTTESDDEDAKRAASSSKRKPYDPDQARQRKRTSGAHRSPSFAMTPLVMSKHGSPELKPLQDINNAVPLPSATAMLDAMSQPPTASLNPVWGSPPNPQGNTLTMTTDPTATTSMADLAGYPYSQGSSPISPHSHQSGLMDPMSGLLNDTPFSNHTSPLPLPSGSQQQHDHNNMMDPHSINEQAVNLFDEAAKLAAASSYGMWPNQLAAPAPPQPQVTRLIPGEGPIHGGIEITILGENFRQGLVVCFGDTPALPTHFWSSNTLICLLPPSSNPGPVVVSLRGIPLTVEDGSGLQLFTYKDDSDRSLLELALQVVGLKMTGRLEDAKDVAMRIVGTSGYNSPQDSRGASPIETNGLALDMNSMSRSAYVTPAGSRVPSRTGSLVSLASLDNYSTRARAGAFPASTGETRSFEGIVIKFLSLLDLESDDVAAPQPVGASPISFKNASDHTLLHLSTFLGFHRLVQFLLARGIDVDAKDRNGYTALHFAALYGRVSIARQLLQAGAAPYLRNMAGKTARDIANDRDDVDVEEVFSRYISTAGEFRPAISRAPSSTSVKSFSNDYEDEEGWSSDEDRDYSDEEDTTDDDDDSHADLERRLSRNASLVSLHHLLACEENEERTSRSRESSARGVPQKAAQEPAHPPTKVSDLATASSGWLAGKLKPAIAGWATPNEAWDKVKTANGLMTLTPRLDLTAFPAAFGLPTKVWPAAKVAQDGQQQPVPAPPRGPRKPPVDWRSFPWRIPSSPPPMYEPMDTLAAGALSLPPPLSEEQAGSPAAGPSSLQQQQQHVYPPQSRAQIEAQLARRVGFVPDEISDTVVQAYLSTETKYKGLRQDRMLYLFWCPILLLVVSYFVLTNLHEFIIPFCMSLLDSVVPSVLLRS